MERRTFLKGSLATLGAILTGTWKWPRPQQQGGYVSEPLLLDADCSFLSDLRWKMAADMALYGDATYVVLYDSHGSLPEHDVDCTWLIGN